jgi:hypothetical protein
MVAQLLSSEALKAAIVGTIKKILPDLVKDVVRSVVKEELEKRLPAGAAPGGPPTFAGVVESGLAAGHVARLTTRIRAEEVAREERRDKLIIRGLRVREDAEQDEVMVRDVARVVGVPLERTLIMVKRLGEKKEDGSQILSIKLPVQERLELLRNAKNLKGHPRLGGVYISPDRTPGEQHADFLLRRELREKRRTESDKEWVISRGRVVEKKSD